MLDCDAFRDVIVEDAVASHYHAWMRTLVYPAFDASACDNQLGSRARRSTAQAAHMVRAWMRWCRNASACAAALFVDVIAAFDEVMRELFLERVPFVWRLHVRIDVLAPSDHIIQFAVVLLSPRITTARGILLLEEAECQPSHVPVVPLAVKIAKIFWLDEAQIGEPR